MDEQTYLDFTSALEAEYSEVISPLCEHAADPHDGYEVFGKAFGHHDISPEKLQAAQVLSTELIRIRDIARRWHESERIGEDDIREVLKRVLSRWPTTSPE